MPLPLAEYSNPPPASALVNIENGSKLNVFSRFKTSISALHQHLGLSVQLLAILFLKILLNLTKLTDGRLNI